MKLYHITTGLLKVNTYFLVNEDTKDAVIVDSGENYNLIKKTEIDLGIKIKYALYTHGHFDHAGSAKKLQDDGVKICISKTDAKKLLNDENLAKNFGRKFGYCTADITFSDGDVLILCGITFKVLETPGHTDGSVTFMVDDMLFTGDTLFYGTVGRTDFITGSRTEMINSIKKLFALSGDYSVYPGHDEFTSLAAERKNNVMAEYE